MAYCPFSLVKEIVKERKVNKTGQVVEEKETPTFHLLECLREKCEVFDLGAKKCSLPILSDRLNSLQDIEAKARQATSDFSEANSALLADLLESSSGILKETQSSKEQIAKLVEGGGAQAAGLPPEFVADLKAAAQALKDSKEAFSGLGTLLKRLEEVLARPDSSRAVAEGLDKLAKGFEESHSAAVQGAMETRVLMEKLAQVPAGAGLDEETRKTLGEIKDILHDNRQSLDHIFSLLPEVLKESQIPLGTFAEANAKGLAGIQESLAKSQESLRQVLGDLTKETKGSGQALIEAYGKESGVLKETITSLGDYLGEAQKEESEALSKALKASQDKMEHALETLPQRLKEAQEPLFTKFAEENKSAFDLFVQGATETTLSLTQLRQNAEKTNEILSTLAASGSDSSERTIESLGRLSESIKLANEETLAKNSELFSLYLGDLVGTIKAGQAETKEALSQKLGDLAAGLKSNQESLITMLLESGEKTQGRLGDLLDSNARALEAMKGLQSALVEAQKESAVGTAEVLKRLQSEARTAQEETATFLGSTVSEGLAKNAAQLTEHAAKLHESASQQQESLFSALSGSLSEALRQNASDLASALEKAESAANDKRSAVQAAMAENREAVEKLQGVLVENAANQGEALKDLGEKLEVLRATLERQSVLESDAFETLGQRITSLRDDERRGTEALLAGLTGGQQVQREATEAIRTALQESAQATREAIAGPQEREARLAKISEDIASSTQALSAFLADQKRLHEEETRKLKNEEARLHNDRGVSLYYQQAYGAAELEFKRALELAPEMAEAYNNLALTMTELGKHEDAQACFRRVLELSPGFAEALNNLGCLYQKMGEHAKAVEAFKDALTKRVDYAGAYVNLGTAYQAMNKVDEALKAWERALAIDPANEKVKEKLAQFKGV